MSFKERKFYGMLRQAILLLLFCAVVFASPVKPLAQYWKETSLTWKKIQGELTPDVCKLNSTNFWGCVETARYVMSKVGLKRDIPSYVVAEALLQNVGGFPLVSVTAKETGFNELSEIKAEQRRVQKFWTAAFANAKRYDFTEMWEWLGKKIPAEIEAETSASAYNIFLGFSADPHTRLVPKAYSDDQDSKTSDEFFGVGVVLARLADEIFVRKVIAGGPAERAGMRVMDGILEVDGVSVRGLSVEAVGQQFTHGGAKKIGLKLKRKGARLSVVLTPEKIVTPRVGVAILDKGKDEVGYLRLADFSGLSNCEEATEAIKHFEQRKVLGIVFDMRANPGGRLNDALCIANLFFPERQRIYSVIPLPGLKGPEFYGDTSVSPATLLPMVTLVDGTSASAAELLAGALQDHARSLIVGNRTFGKGTVQYPSRWKHNDAINLNETRAVFYLPSGRTNQLVSLLPDLVEPEVGPIVRQEDLYFNPVQVAPNRKFPPRDFSALAECVDLEKKGNSRASADAAVGTAMAALTCWRNHGSLRWEYISGSDL